MWNARKTRKIASRRFFRGLAACAVIFATSACDSLPFPAIPPLALSPSLVQSEETTPFSVIPAGRMWVQFPGAVVAMERGLVNSREQRIGLVNGTTTEGDNFMQLRARYMQGARLGRFRFEEFLRRVGGPPEPFAAIDSGDLLTEGDEMGTYFWAEQGNGGSTNCVLAFRRLDSGARQMPGGADVLDVMLRNCVNGSVDEALLPIMAESLGGYPAGSTRETGGIRMLSPLAGPALP